jgi:hypothetical protein
VHNPARSFGQEIIALLDRVWPVVKGGSIPNKGINWAVYEEGGGLFAGIEAGVTDASALGLELRTIRLARYAEWKHVGPYSRLGESYDALKNELDAMGLRPGRPLVEVYGHWTEDESKLETTILMTVL